MDSLLLLGGLAFLIGAVLLGLVLRTARMETQMVGTALLPLFKWCSLKNVFRVICVLPVMVTGMVGLTVGAYPGPLPAEVTTIIRSLIALSALCGLVGNIILDILWNRMESRWSPLIVQATSNQFCTYCGHPTQEGKPLGGYCPICGADPDKPCDPNRHARYETTGDPRPKRTRHRR